MRILLKEQIEYYRYTVAKVVFLEAYKEYELLEDIANSNCLRVYNKLTKEVLYISLFGEAKGATKTIDKSFPTHIYYEKKNFNIHREKQENKGLIVYSLNNEFDRLFENAIENAFINTAAYFENLSSNNIELFEYYFSEAHKKILTYSRFCKYYSKDKEEVIKHDAKEGTLSFTHPKHFNDPFDCNCSLSNNADMSDKFRVLCLTTQYDNILMWSYYSNNHKGYCFEYVIHTLLDQIKRNNLKGLCVFGNVTYSDKRPAQKSEVDRFSFTDLDHYIRAVFTKYKRWEHEDECRFVIISNNFADYKESVQISTTIDRVYVGCLGEELKESQNDARKLEVIKLLKDNKEYSLNAKRITLTSV